MKIFKIFLIILLFSISSVYAQLVIPPSPYQSTPIDTIKSEQYVSELGACNLSNYFTKASVYKNTALCIFLSTSVIGSLLCLTPYVNNLSNKVNYCIAGGTIIGVGFLMALSFEIISNNQFKKAGLAIEYEYPSIKIKF